MKFLQRIESIAQRYEAHPRLQWVMTKIDQLITLVSTRHYQGENPAMRGVYAPLRASVIVMLTISLIAILFGAIVPVESAAIAKGSVAVLTKRKTVQHLEGGIIKAILVKEGDVVTQGQPLLELNDVSPKATRSIVQKELWVHRASESRLVALQNNDKELTFSTEMQHVSESNAELHQAMQTQAELFITQRDAQTGKINSLKQRIAEANEEIVGLEAQIKSAEGQLAYTEEEIKSVKSLLKDGLATKPRLLALQRQAEELRGSRGQNTALIAKARQTIAGSEMDVINQINDFATKNAEELRDVRVQIADSEEKLRAATDVVERTIVTAPTEGVVTGLKFHTIGGVVSPATPILDIVPQSDALVLEVHVQPTDIDVVKTGMEARIIFPAYRSRRMPLFTGKVTQVSADAFNEQQAGQNISFYTARIEVDGGNSQAAEAGVNLYPGMPADVYIRTGARSFIGYMLEPITESMDRAFKEE